MILLFAIVGQLLCIVVEVAVVLHQTDLYSVCVLLLKIFVEAP